jgi:hypothetical protein
MTEVLATNTDNRSLQRVLFSDKRARLPEYEEAGGAILSEMKFRQK